ncbi:MAG TPA: hypothetical protein VFW60_06455 [Rhodanobacteraceae bacterium]|nr:hypothetical protein [Rhodanobacteraceae bacterium]
MHDRLDHHRMNDDASLAAALRALPAITPGKDLWPELAARIRRRRGVRKAVWFSLPAAFAAGIAFALAWPHLHPNATTQPPVAVARTSAPAKKTVATTDIAALQASSKQWQAWVQNLDLNGAPLDGRRLAQAVTLQDHIALVDLQLSAARKPATVADLWQQRITLLQQLGLLHLQPYTVAEQARPAATHAIPM